MKKQIQLLFVLLFMISGIHADGGWGTSYVSLTKDRGGEYKYVLNQESWSDYPQYMTNTVFDQHDFGTPASLILNGASGNAWADKGDYYDNTSFILYYRVYPQGTTPGAWLSVPLNVLAYNVGNNSIYEKTFSAIDILALATIQGTNTYIVEVTMSKNQKWEGGNWNCMIPEGQGTAYDTATQGYKAFFTKSITTNIQHADNQQKIVIENGMLHASFPNKSKVELLSLSGQMLHQKTATNEFEHEVKSGIYLLRVNGKTQEIIVK